MNILKISFFCIITSALQAQIYEKFPIQNTESFRGISFESANTFVFSGTNNTIGKSNDAGKTIEWLSVHHLETKHDFRDIEVLQAQHYLAMAIDSPAYIVESKNGGKTWTTVYENSTKGIFLDAMYYHPKSKDVFVVGDPLDGKMPFIVHANASNTKEWTILKKLNNQYLRLANPKEAFFAASGSNLYADEHQILLVSGGAASLLYRYTKKEVQGYQLDKTNSPTSGIYGMDYNPTLNFGILVGGDYTKPNADDNNFYKFKIENNKVVFTNMYSIPKGYLSSVSIVNKDTFAVCGPGGVQYTSDNGINWKYLTKDAYNTCKVSPDKKYILLVGPKGNVGKILL
ncbi:WD40/YVTN/BNR-like repeat-containing protein [Vaginella massiliensis]|uniref:WD40/YVTN/BNR-like repeat-containing protein n=1 Tax=Vaginella massiliensis TaxID=1816680 RepID=UPI00083949C0|nr:hypothetical protein [Vaginella massiliensis]